MAKSLLPDSAAAGAGSRHLRRRHEQLASALAQDRREVELLVGAARRILESHGSDRVTVREVLSEAGLGTRAFYRHFASRDQLILAVFSEGARREGARLSARMARASTPRKAVVAWIDGRLELAFDRRVAAELKELSLEAQLRRRQAPVELQEASELMLAPLVRQLEEGRRLGLFDRADPARDARAIHEVVWGVIERQWSGARLIPEDERDAVLRFCLRGIGAVHPPSGDGGAEGHLA